MVWWVARVDTYVIFLGLLLVVLLMVIGALLDCYSFLLIWVWVLL